MRTVYRYLAVLAILALTGCSPPGAGVPETGGTITAPAAPPTQPPPTFTAATTPLPSITATAAPTRTATPAVLPFELVEWAQFPYANPADPQNADTHVEVLIRNPNPFPVRIDQDETELRFLNAAGEVVYANPNPRFYLWEGSWIRGGETLAISACVCLQSSGLERQPWETLELVAPLQAAPGTAFTTDIEVTLGEFFGLYGGDQMAAEINLKNASDQVLKGFEVIVFARDSAGKYVGVAISGQFIDRDANGNYVKIEPGSSGGGIVPSEIDYVSGPLEYELVAIGIPME